MNQPFLPLFFGDLLASTPTWEGEERSLYILLLAYQWSSGPLPKDTKRLARMTQYDPETFAKLWETVGKKFRLSADGLVNDRLEKHRQKSKDLSEKNSRSGAKGAAARWRNDGERHSERHSTEDSERHQTANGVTHGNPSHPIPSQSIPDKNQETTARKRAHADQEPEGFAELRKQYPRRAGGQPWNRAVKAWRARISAGATPNDILAGVGRYAEYIRATGKEGTEFVMQAATFLGPDEHFRNQFKPPDKPETAYEEIQRLNGLNGARNGTGRVFEAEQGGNAVGASLGLIRGGIA